MSLWLQYLVGLCRVVYYDNGRKIMIHKINPIKKFALIAALVSVIGGASLSGMVYAAPTTTFAAGSASFTLLPPWYNNLTESDGSGGTKIKSPSGDIKGWLSTLVLNLITDLLYITGYVSLGFIIWGGFKFMINGDNSSGVAAARKTIQNAVIGLVISIFAVAIVSALSGAFG